jgi:hypothetical protein
MIKLTCRDNSTVYVAWNCICSLYKANGSTTVLLTIGGNENYYIVTETVDTIIRLRENVMIYERDLK